MDKKGTKEYGQKLLNTRKAFKENDSNLNVGT